MFYEYDEKELGVRQNQGQIPVIFICVTLSASAVIGKNTPLAACGHQVQFHGPLSTPPPQLTPFYRLTPPHSLEHSWRDDAFTPAGIHSTRMAASYSSNPSPARLGQPSIKSFTPSYNCIR